jgi:diaminohydroxyphosphoribosylaminopyrimidine deaminase/5-amino-6-(5-phosphoribosylamino)uracil reductase
VAELQFMKRAIELARLGAGKTSPNPLVGAVIIKNGRIIGEGYHVCAGQKHAEVAAIDNATESVKGATLYCNLEPCCHLTPSKRTPPCTSRIISEGIKKVVIANYDPNPCVSGKGIETLIAAGIDVEVGILHDEAMMMNQPFFKFIQTGLAYIHLKIAQTLDGRIATYSGDSRWITDENARRLVHQWRANVDAVLVGVNTVIMDNPRLTVRLAEGKQPSRLILDTHLRTPLNAHIVSDQYRQQSHIFTASDNQCKIDVFMEKGVQIHRVPTADDGKLSLPETLKMLGKLNISNVLVEGGAAIFTSFIRQTLFDKISVFIAPIIMGEGRSSVLDLGTTSVKEAKRLKNVQFSTLNEQVLIEGYGTIWKDIPEKIAQMQQSILASK